MEIERKLAIIYRWWRHDGEIKKEHIEALEEAAMERILKCMEEGFHSGELVDNIFMTNDDPEDGIDYDGWWEIQKEDLKVTNQKRNPAYRGPS